MAAGTFQVSQSQLVSFPRLFLQSTGPMMLFATAIVLVSYAAAARRTLLNLSMDFLVYTMTSAHKRGRGYGH